MGNMLCCRRYLGACIPNLFGVAPLEISEIDMCRYICYVPMFKGLPSPNSYLTLYTYVHNIYIYPYPSLLSQNYRIFQIQNG